MNTPPPTPRYALFHVNRRDVFFYVLTFVAIFAGGKFGQFLFFTLDIDPAYIWPPVGISIAAIYLGGYRMVLAIVLAYVAVFFTNETTRALPVLVLVTAILAYPLQALLGGSILRHFRYSGTMRHTRDALLLIGTALTVPALAPTLSALARAQHGASFDTLLPFWVMVYAGGVFSILVLTPLITVAATLRAPVRTLVAQRLESFAVFGALFVSIYVLFWTTVAQINIFLSLYVFLAVLFWIAMRIGGRAMTIAIALIAVFGFGGIFFQHGGDTTVLGSQLLASELFIILITPILYVVTALVEERKRTTKILERRTEELERSLHKLSQDDEAKNEFLSVLAHELRNPLAPIASTIELLTLQSTNLRERALLEGAQLQLVSMKRLLDDLLDVARITQKRFELQKEYVSLNLILNQSADSTRHLMRALKHSFSVSLPERDISVYVDPVRLQQMVINLLNNAAKYTQVGGTIKLRCEYTDDFFTIHVTDSGVGIPESQREWIFQPFQQTRNNAVVGTGLGVGLWLTKRLVEMHHGEITVHSKGVNQGSTFTATIPRTPTPLQHEHKKDGGVTIQNKPGKKSILIVDDNHAATDSLAALLSHVGHAVQKAYSGGAAIERVLATSPDVILLDIGLPDMDGYAVARELRANKVTAIVVALSGYGQESDKQRAFDAGFDYYLVKPVGIREIESVLKKI